MWVNFSCGWDPGESEDPEQKQYFNTLKDKKKSQ